MKVQRMVRRSKLGQPVMLHAIAYALSTDFAEEPKAWLDMADAIFASQLQSRINEKGNKVSREAEMRDALSHVAHSPIYVVSTYDHIVGNEQELRRPASRTSCTLLNIYPYIYLSATIAALHLH